MNTAYPVLFTIILYRCVQDCYIAINLKPVYYFIIYLLLNNKHSIILTFSVGQEFGNNLGVWFWPGVSAEIAVRALAGASPLNVCWRWWTCFQVDLTRMPSSWCWLLLGGPSSSSHGPSTGCHSVLMIWWPASPRVSDPRKSHLEALFLYDLFSGVT